MLDGLYKKFLSLTRIKRMKHKVDRKELEPKQDKIKKCNSFSFQSGCLPAKQTHKNSLEMLKVFSVTSTELIA